MAQIDILIVAYIDASMLVKEITAPLGFLNDYIYIYNSKDTIAFATIRITSTQEICPCVSQLRKMRYFLNVLVPIPVARRIDSIAQSVESFPKYPL